MYNYALAEYFVLVCGLLYFFPSSLPPLSPPPAPTPNVSISSTTVRLPSVSPYNTLTLTCTATLPVPRDALHASLSFTWLKGSDDVTSSSSSSDPLTSTLTRQETTPSTLTYTCRYNVVVSGDTPYTADTSATVTVTGEMIRNSNYVRIHVELIISM